MNIEWTDGFEIRVRADKDAVVLSANKAGLLSLAKQFIALAAAEPGDHLHYDESNCLEEGSAELIVERVP